MSVPGLPPRDEAFRTHASDAWIAAELAKRRVTHGFDRRRDSPLAAELAAQWWTLVQADPNPLLFRPGLAPAPPARGRPHAPASSAAVPSVPSLGTAAPPRNAPTPPIPPPAREARLGVTPPATPAPQAVPPPRAEAPAPPSKAVPPSNAVPPPKAVPPAPKQPAHDEPQFTALPAGVRELAKGLMRADRPGAPALKRLIAAHLPETWPAGADPTTHPAWDTARAACARTVPPVSWTHAEPVMRAILASLGGAAGADLELDQALRAPIAGAPAHRALAPVLEGLPLQRRMTTSLRRTWEVIDATQGPLDGVLGEALAAREQAWSGRTVGQSAAPAPVAPSRDTSALPPPSERWAASLARQRPVVRAAVSRWLDEAAGQFGRASTWTEALAFVRDHPRLVNPIEAFPEDAWALLAAASPVIAAGHAKGFTDPTLFGIFEQEALVTALTEGQAPALAARLRDALLGAPPSTLSASIDAALAALPSWAIAGEQDATGAPYGRFARWDGARLLVAWPKHAAWKDPAAPSTRLVKLPFWPAALAGPAAPQFEVHESLVPALLDAMPRYASLSDLLDDLDLARAHNRHEVALVALREDIAAAYERVQAEFVVDGDLATAARQALDTVTYDVLETG